MNHTNAFNLIQSYFEPLGFECYQFKIGLYNAVVQEKFKLNYDANTYAIFILNTPSMFERTFLPYALETIDNIDKLRDPIDECMNSLFIKAKHILEEKNFEIDTIQDYELTPTRRAKILLQSCAHICALNTHLDEPVYKLKYSMGVCIHPKYGGWFAMRGVLIFKNLSTPDLCVQQPVDVLNSDENLINSLLERFNNDWKSGSYRDIISVTEKYSQKQIEYFNTEPKHRKDLLFNWFLDNKNIQ